VCIKDPVGVTGEGERERSNRGRKVEGGGFAGGRTLTVAAKRAKDSSGKEGAMARAGNTSGAGRENAGEALHADTEGAKETEGSRAVKAKASRESPEDDGPSPWPAKGELSGKEDDKV
jgi:hypothetical protein